MFLLDTNIWLERLLGQEQAEVVGTLLDRLNPAEFCLTDFTLHSIGVICGRFRQASVYKQFVQDVLIDSGVLLVSVPPREMERVVAVMESFRLDFDDAYQYVAAEREQAMIISFDKDFDRTERGRQTPAQVLQ